MKKYVSIIVAMFLVFAVHSQSADVITEILETDEVTFGQVCYLSAVEQGLISEEDSYDMAIEMLVANGNLPEIGDANIPIPVVNISFILSQIWDVKGGLMYKITKGSPRYSFKQFKADGVIDRNADPKDTISGSELLTMYTAGLETYGNFDIGAVSMEIE